MVETEKIYELRLSKYKLLLRRAEENNWDSLIPYYKGKIAELEARKC